MLLTSRQFLKTKVELLLGDEASPEHQEVNHMKKKTVEFNLNIPKSPTGYSREPHLDQRPNNIHTTLKDHVEPHPTLENRSVHLDEELYCHMLVTQFLKDPIIADGFRDLCPHIVNSHLGKNHVLGGLLSTSAEHFWKVKLH